MLNDRGDKRAIAIVTRPVEQVSCVEECKQMMRTMREMWSEDREEEKKEQEKKKNEALPKKQRKKQ